MRDRIRSLEVALLPSRLKVGLRIHNTHLKGMRGLPVVRCCYTDLCGYGEDIELSIDANACYSASKACELVELTRETRLAYFEQPVAQDVLAGLRQVWQLTCAARDSDAGQHCPGQLADTVEFSLLEPLFTDEVSTGADTGDAGAEPSLQALFV